MKIEIYPSQLEGTIRIPGSKSAAQRFLAGALMSNGKTIIREFPQGDDVESSLKIIQALGAVVQQKGNQVEIKGGFPSSFRSGIRNPKAEIQCGESGLAARMFIPISALHNETITVNGTGSLLSRPFDGIVEPLESLGAKVKTNSTYLPVQIKGPLRGGSATVDGRLSSQFLSGLLFALPLCKLDSELTVEQLKSKPYISMSLEILRSFRIEIEQVDSTLFRIAGNQVFQAQDCTVPGDWSGAACIIVAGVLCSEQGIVLEGLSNQLTQGDAAIAQILKKMGASIEQKSNSIRVSKSTIRAFEFDATDCPDLFPPLCALAAFADGPSVLKGANRLRHKESNRGKTLQEELGKANIRIVLRDNEMIVYPGHIRPAVLSSRNDHRIAMTAAILGLAGAKITLTNAGAVSKSYPGFYDAIALLKGKINVKDGY